VTTKYLSFKYLLHLVVLNKWKLSSSRLVHKSIDTVCIHRVTVTKFLHSYQGNVNILQHLQSDRRPGARTKLFLNILIRFHLNNMANLHQITLQSTTSCPTTWRSYRDHRLLWRHFTQCIYVATVRNAKYCEQRVCVPVRSHISKTTSPNIIKLSVHVTCCRSSDLF